ncbi:surface anchored protein [Streptococcus pneumoniae]|nr:surface anchored protein [Streptococcus pneumoniae]
MDKSLAESAQSSLQALLANLTLDSMKELHARVEAGLARAKAVLENPHSSQEEVNTQVRTMRELTEEVNKALAGGLTSPTELGEGSGATPSEASPTPKRGRRGRKPLTPPATPAPVENQEKKETVEEATDYTNGQGSYPLSDKIHNLLQELKTSTENPEQVQKLKEAYDKLNEALQTKEDGLVDDAIFNVALEEYKKASHLMKGAEGAAKTRSRRSVSELVYGFATGSPGNERRLTNSDGSGKDSVALLNSSDLDDAPLRFIATVENGGIREFSLKNFPDTDNLGKKWATITVTYSSDRKKALIKVTGKTPKNIYGLYNVTPEVTLNSGHVQSRILQVRYQLPKAEFDLSPLGTGNTAQQDVEGKAKAKGNDRPVLKVKVPLPPNGSVDSKNIPAKGQFKVFLVRGGNNQVFGKTATAAENYDIVAQTLVKSDGTGDIVPPSYLKESIGDQPLRLVTAYVRQGTNNPIDSDFVSPLSDDSITPTNPIDRDGAKAKAEQKAQAKKDSFNGIQHLTDEEKTAANQQVEAALDKAKKAIDGASNQRDIDAANQTLDTELGQITPKAEANKTAKAKAEQKAQAKKDSFNGIQHLTDEEKTAANQQVEAALDKAKKAIDGASNQRDIDAANQTLDTELGQITPKAEANKTAKAKAEQKANLTLDLIDDNVNLSLFEKDAAKNQVRQALQDALKRIDQAKTQNGIDRAKQEALSSLDQVLAEALARANARRLSGQDSATRNRRTPPRRARRSVGFVGNSQTGTTPSAVDKSELRTLVEDLERRLQDLAGLSPEALEEAHRILGEAQAALANDSLTAQELAELLAKVREALNSLQAGTSADKSPSTSNSNKEAESAKEPTNATDVPLYGVFGAAVLSLLGALLFALAHKKNSQLDKLSRELDQLLVELEASDKDKKGLGKAKKLAKKARTFVDSQQKDPQKEAELISEIKTILSQLREGV